MKKLLTPFFFNVKSKASHIPLSLVVCLVLASCNLPNSQSTPTRAADAVYTAAAQTVSAQLTAGANNPAVGPTLAVETPAPSNTAAATSANTPLAQITQTSVPNQPSPTAQVCDRADFVQDVTIPDGTNVVPGDKFIKTWRLKNTGTCTWTTSYAAIFDHDNMMGAQSTISLTRNVAPGETTDISVEMTAPNTPGKYSGYWKLRNDKGTIFGLGSTIDKPFYLQIEVAATLFSVTGVYPSLDPAVFSGVCNPASIKFKADIRASKAGTVQYHWKFSESSDSPVMSISFTEAGTKSMEYTLNISKAAGEYTGWGVVYIDDPNHQEFGKINYTLKCQ